MGIRRQREKLFQIILIVSTFFPSKRHETPIVLSKSKTSNRVVVQEGSQDYLNSKQNSKSCESLEKELRKTFF